MQFAIAFKKALNTIWLDEIKTVPNYKRQDEWEFIQGTKLELKKIFISGMWWTERSNNVIWTSNGLTFSHEIVLSHETRFKNERDLWGVLIDFIWFFKSHFISFANVLELFDANSCTLQTFLKVFQFNLVFLVSQYALSSCQEQDASCFLEKAEYVCTLCSENEDKIIK